MTDEELEAEVAMALLCGESDAKRGTFRWHGKVIAYTVTFRDWSIHATLELRDGPKVSAQTTCKVCSEAELRSTAIRWGIGMVQTLEPIQKKQGTKYL